MEKLRQYFGALVLFAIAVVAFLGVVIFIWLAMGTAGATPVSESSYSREIARGGHPVVDEGFKSFVISREGDDTFIVSGEKLTGAAVSISVLVMDETLGGRQLRSDQGVERDGMLAPIGDTLCRSEHSPDMARPCSIIEFAAGQTGRFELTFTPANWLAEPSYTVSVDNDHGGSMNIHEPKREVNHL